MSIITLHGGREIKNRYSWSPFVTKLEARLRFDGVSYRREDGDIVKAPHGKLPYIDLTSSNTPGQTLPDSTLIAKKLVEYGVLVDLNKGLGAVEKAHDLSLRALLETKIYFYQSSVDESEQKNNERWIENYYTMRSKIFGSMPYPLQVVIGLMAYRANEQTLRGQGTTRFSQQEIAAFQLEAWNSVNELVVAAQRNAKSGSNEPFWLWNTDGPCEADTSLFGFVVSEFACDASPKGEALMRSMPAIVDYARRIHERHFPDYEYWD